MIKASIGGLVTAVSYWELLPFLACMYRSPSAEHIAPSKYSHWSPVQICIGQVRFQRLDNTNSHLQCSQCHIPNHKDFQHILVEVASHKVSDYTWAPNTPAVHWDPYCLRGSRPQWISPRNHFHSEWCSCRQAKPVDNPKSRTYKVGPVELSAGDQ